MSHHSQLGFRSSQSTCSVTSYVEWNSTTRYTGLLYLLPRLTFLVQALVQGCLTFLFVGPNEEFLKRSQAGLPVPVNETE